jgi:predicted metal-dependent enzyme (double-stranded beta helix superfamily)
MGMTTREEAVADLFTRVREAQGKAEITRAGVDAIAESLRRLAERHELFPLEDFPLPGGKRSILYVLGKDEVSGSVIYAVRSTPSTERPTPRPHNHATWAAVATVYGNELQEIYERTDDGTNPGRGSLRKDREFVVAPGTVIGYLPNEFHSVASVGDGPGLALHFYGRGLDTITDRIVFEGPDGGAYETFLMGPELFVPLPAAVAL